MGRLKQKIDAAEPEISCISYFTHILLPCLNLLPTLPTIQLACQQFSLLPLVIKLTGEIISVEALDSEKNSSNFSKPSPTSTFNQEVAPAHTSTSTSQTLRNRSCGLTLRRCCSHRLRHPWLPPPCRSYLERKDEFPR